MKTVSLELAKQLKAKGIEIKTLCQWDEDIYGRIQLFFDGQYLGEDMNSYSRSPKAIPAPSTDELLEWLPKQMGHTHDLTICWNENDEAWNSGYWLFDSNELDRAYEEFVDSKNPADCLAKLALWVKEQETKQLDS